jgi:hypothetical protein
MMTCIRIGWETSKKILNVKYPDETEESTPKEQSTAEVSMPVLGQVESASRGGTTWTLKHGNILLRTSIRAYATTIFYSQRIRRSTNHPILWSSCSMR